MLKDQIKSLARQFWQDAVDIRRRLHQFPELSFQEVETGKFIAEKLTEYGIPHVHGMAENGVVALIEGREPGSKVIALRADIDALPIEEVNEVPYRSRNQGVMHACGHDVHTASLLGVARILFALRGSFSGTVKLIFQPAEELLPGGASLMIKEGVLKNPDVAGILGQHVHPPLEVGKVGFRAGRYMGSADELYVTVRGKGGHGALPHDCIDPIVITSQIIIALQQIVSRYANPILPTVLTFGMIQSDGGATNIIPETVRLKGTFRTLDETWRFQAHKRMRAIAENMASAMGGSCDFRIEVGYPFLHNDEALTNRARMAAEDFLGPENVVDLPVRLTAEDFAYYTQEIPSCFYRLGTGNPETGIVHPVHSSRFDIDERALETGMGLMAWLAVRELEEGLGIRD